MTVNNKPISPFDWKDTPSVLARDKAINGCNAKKNQRKEKLGCGLTAIDTGYNFSPKTYSRAK